LGFENFDAAQKSELWAALALQHTAGLGVNKRKKLADFFGSAYLAVQAAKQWTSAGLNINSASADYFLRGGWREQAGLCWKLIKKCPANLLLYTDAQYPPLLKEIHDAPLLLFYFGELALLQNISVAVVGARKSTSEGVAVAVNIVRGLTHAGVTAISGLAAGIDRAVHLAGLEGIGSSIAVLGSGIDRPYPEANRGLYELMRHQGLIISEFMPGTAPFSGNFPVRNRIISGLARAVLVVEASARSGTLITARHATEQNRDVFAVPGPSLASTSAGCRELIRRGAKPVFSAEDILLELSPMLKPELATKCADKPRVEARDEHTAALARSGGNNKKSVFRNGLPDGLKKIKTPVGEPSVGSAPPGKKHPLPEENGHTDIVKLLEQKNNCHIEELAIQLNMPIARLSGVLAVLEVKGLVKRLPGMFYSVRTQ
jgi:DNA processing protein